MKRKKCSHDGCNNPVWANGKCKNHTPRKSIKSQRDYVFITDRKGKKAIAKAIGAKLMHEFFMEIWKKRPHKSEVSGTRLGNEALSTYFHHILPKHRYPEAAYDEENIIIMTPDEHNNVENDKFRYEEVNTRREGLLKKYNLI